MYILKWTYSYVGVCASFSSILLCSRFLFWNPYSETVASRDTILILLVMLVAPAGLGLISSLARNGKLMYMAFFWSLPAGLYLSVASIPSIWNLFGVTIILYLVSAIQMRKRHRHP